MFHPVSVFVGFRYLRGQSGDRFSRFVSYMSTAGITIGVLALVTVLSVMNGFESQLKQRILGVLPQAVVTSDSGKVQLDKPLPEKISQLSVRTPDPIVRSEAVIQSHAELTAGMMLGIEPKPDNSVEPYVIAGSVNNLVAGKFRVLLGRRLARTLEVNVGDTVRIMVTEASQFTPLGRIPSQRNFVIAGLFDTGSDVDGQLMVLNLRDAQRLLHYHQHTVSGWRLYFEDPFVVSTLAAQPLPEAWKWTDWRDQRGELFQAVKMEKNMMSLMLGLIVGIAAFNIISALIMVVMEKQSEVAILKTQGMSNRQILTIFIIQGASSGVIGAIIGGLLGVIVAENLNNILHLLGADILTVGGSLPVVIHPAQIIWVELLTILLSVVATLYPSFRASTVKPAEALRYE